MESPMLLWYLLVGALLMAFFVHFVRSVRQDHHAAHVRHHHLIELGREREMFYIPGDVPADREDDDDDD